ncbi:MAG: Hsp20 family protein, partial [Bacteroidia bacterium]|nr:Hsp20 family protein [Bacteroidia bacterium]
MMYAARTTSQSAQQNVYTPHADVYQTEKGYVFEFALPGVDKDSVSVSVESGGLVVSGERKTTRN